MAGADRRGLLAALLVASPVVVGVAYAVAGALGVAGAGAGGLSGARIVRVMGEAAVWESVGWTLWVAAASTLLATVAAIGIAVVFRGGGRMDRVARAAAAIPLPVPHVVAGVMGLLVLGQSGLLSRLAHAAGWIAAPGEMPALVYDRFGIGLVATMAWKETAFLAVVAWGILAGRGAELEEAARTLGADRWQTFRRVTLPILWRGLLPAAAAAFAFVLGSYEAAVLLGPSDPLPLPVLTMERYTDAALSRRGDAYVLVLLGIGLAALVVAAHERARARWESLDS
jgi:putative spermidine/putrescine transport system permease protein